MHPLTHILVCELDTFGSQFMFLTRVREPFSMNTPPLQILVVDRLQQRISLLQTL